MNTRTLVSLLALALAISGCSQRENVSPVPTIDPEVRAELNSPVNCRTARSDIATLEQEKASVGRQMLAGARAIMPIAAVAGILMGDYRDRVSVATGQYNSDIEDKILQIRKACGVR